MNSALLATQLANVVCPEDLQWDGKTFRTDGDWVAECWQESWRKYKRLCIDTAYKTVVILCGPPGSGKSHWREAIAASKPATIFWDACHTNLWRRGSPITIARDSGRTGPPLNFRCVVFETPLAECLARNAERIESRRVPAATISEHFAALAKDHPRNDPLHWWTAVSYEGSTKR